MLEISWKDCFNWLWISILHFCLPFLAIIFLSTRTVILENFTVFLTRFTCSHVPWQGTSANAFSSGTFPFHPTHICWELICARDREHRRWIRHWPPLRHSSRYQIWRKFQDSVLSTFLVVDVNIAWNKGPGLLWGLVTSQAEEVFRGGWLFQDEGTTWSNSGVPGVCGWMEQGVEVEEAGERSGKIISLAMCAYWRLSRCTRYLLWTRSGCWFAHVIMYRLSEENGSLWLSLGNYSWTCWDFSLETEQHYTWFMTLGVCVHLWSRLRVVQQVHCGGAKAAVPARVPLASITAPSTPPPTLGVSAGTRLQSYICDSFARVMWRLCPLVRSLDFLNWASCYFN